MKIWIKDDWRQKYLEARSQEQMRRDLVHAFDRIRFLKLQVWVLSAAALWEGGLIRWLGDKLLTCVEASHHLAMLK